MEASDITSSVRFSFHSEEEIRRMSVKRLTKPDLLDSKGMPVPDGLYDPALGPVNDNDSCKYCGQNSFQCPGHFGHIDLAKPIYNPLLFKKLRSLLQNTCFHCYRFLAKEEKIKMCCAALELIVKGDVCGAKDFESSAWREIFLGNEDGSVTYANVHDGSESTSWRQDTWTSLQYREALLIIEKLLAVKVKKCPHCGKTNPTITSPEYGWLNKVLGASAKRANIILEGTGANNRELQSGTVISSDGESLSSEKQPISRSQERYSDASLIKMLGAGDSGRKHLLATEAEHILKNLWKEEARLCMLLCDIQQTMSSSQREKGYEKFLLKCLLVSPNRFRPSSGSSNQVMEHPQNLLLSKVQECNNALWLQLSTDPSHLSIMGKWIDLQRSVNVLFDSSKGYAKSDNIICLGIRQLLEKKSGILRQKMMGKRVNYACRSVISPDPYLAVNEIGIPPTFAVKLTYPERVTSFNSKNLREAVMKGANEHPGATQFKDGDNTIKLQASKSKRSAIARKLQTSKEVPSQMQNGPAPVTDGKTVLRHMRDGDVVLVNRQPSLHKSSMMAHIVRIQKGATSNTIRMHYANCKTYNADFDGDEMNVHLPQDELSRAEALNIVNANLQYIVPTSGEPIRGLIQDHIVSGVLLTKLDTFLSRDVYNELLYHSLVPSSGDSLEGRIEIPRPAIEKPKALWTGKQVILVILNHVTKGSPPFSVAQKGKIPVNYIPNHAEKISAKFADGTPVQILEDVSERGLYIHENELLKGMIDKALFGKNGIVHTVYELYGADAAGNLLYIFSRLFTWFLQMHGFSCGIDDLKVHKEADKERTRILGESEVESKKVHKKFTQAEYDTDAPMLQKNVEKIISMNREANTLTLDRNMSSSLNEITSKVNGVVFPDGLVIPFGKNCLSLMTLTGAKGGSVNMTQISSLLGQQELEGKRVPRNISGKTLPSFPPWDISSRAGGYIADRFFSAIRPQEFYFHCMAGREGLVDTAVKTSRSGYLQRCLIKNLESLRIAYDYTVRDVDGSLVQFLYGEDGVDVMKTSFLTEVKELSNNRRVVLDKLAGHRGSNSLVKHSAFISGLPEKLEDEVGDFVDSLKDKRSRHKKIKETTELVALKYFSSLADPGEAVGVLAAQSIGEPSTQMTLNTFHLAGGGSNVTLGIPRLQEIIMTASENIRTPVMWCPVRADLTLEDSQETAAKLRKVSVADIIERMEVSTAPFFLQQRSACKLYKLKIKLYPKEKFPPSFEFDLIECHDVLREVFVTTLEGDIQKHLDMLHNINDIKSVQRKDDDGSGEEDDAADRVDKEDAETSDVDVETGDDLGGDAERRKRQEADEIEYDDDIEAISAQKQAADELEYNDNGSNVDNDVICPPEDEEQEELQSEYESGIDQVDTEDHEIDAMDIGEEPNTPGMPGKSPIADSENMDVSSDKKKKKSSKTSSKKTKERKVRGKSKKGKGRCIHLDINDLNFEAHFVLLGEEPNLSLAKIAQITASKVYVKYSEKIESCSAEKIEKDKDVVLFLLRTSGVNFGAFWDLQEKLDINKIGSNDINAMLRTYGVEAARATIIKEIKEVFGAYGIEVNYRHLTLIADFMTFDGKYRPMSRIGMGSYGVSPFGKMTFETATNFIVDSAYYGEVDRLESPSASVSLGQPVKLGTGCMSLLQKLDL